jgi:hypothetical protein
LLGLSAPASYGASFPSDRTIELDAAGSRSLASTARSNLVLGWALFGLAFALGLLAGWLIWG